MSEQSMSLTARLAYGPLLILALVNVPIVWTYWGWLDEPGSYIYRVAGTALLAFEYFALAIVSDNFARGAVARALSTLALLAVLLTASLVAEFGAVVMRTAAVGETRAQAVALYDEATRVRDEAERDAARLSAMLEGQGRNLPRAALSAQAQQTAARRDAYVAAGRQPPWRIADAATQAESAEATGQARDAALARRDQAIRYLIDTGARPSLYDAHSEQTAALLAMLGISTPPNQVRIVLSFAFALLMKSTLVIGFWSLSQHARLRRQPLPGSGPEPGAADPAVAAPSEPRKLAPPVEPAAKQGDAKIRDPVRAALEDLENGKA
jgi:hypothetical protein